jgi:TRAP-type C4-dicarboxylate transport system permease small subunit
MSVAGGGDLTKEDIDDLEERSPIPSNFLRRPHRYPEEIATLLLLLGVAITTLLGITFRYVIGDPQSWTEPLARYLLVWLTFMGAAVAVKHELHMSVELPTGRISPAVLHGARIFARVAQMALFVYLIIYGFNLAQANTTPTTVPVISRNHVLLAVPVSALVMLFHSGRHLVTDIRRA